MSADDLTGDWDGIYSYPRDHPATAFAARLRQEGDRLTGIVAEEDQIGGAGALEAILDGRRDGVAVRFTKLYDGASPDYDIVAYEGEVDEAGEEIAGRWTVPGVWSGSFVMVRRPAATATVEAEEAVPVR